jgi:uncharacterized protein (TIGR01777 family)
MKVVLTGSSGFLGAALVERLLDDGHQVLRLVRPPAAAEPGTALWDPERGVLDTGCLEWAEAVIHLAGASVGAHRWTRAYKQTILQSRTVSTRLLADSLAVLAHPPAVLVTASATGIYGDRGDETLTEESAPGEGFRAMVCREWEAAARPAIQAGTRLVPLRFGIVLGHRGGLLPLLTRPARMNMGLRFGNGRQFISWILLDDAVAAVLRVLHDTTLEGPVNVTAPHPVTNAQFARCLAETLQRPAIGYAPGWALKLLTGPERAREVFLSSQRAVPRQLLERGFCFENPEISGALRTAIEE